MKYFVAEISGRQYMVVPNRPFVVDFVGDTDKLSVDKVLLRSDAKLEVGTPYLKEAVVLKVLESFKDKKIRVAKYHAKANTRKVRGYRAKKSKVVYQSVKSA